MLTGNHPAQKEESSELLLHEEKYVPLEDWPAPRRPATRFQVAGFLLLTALLAISAALNVKTLYQLHTMASADICRPTNSNLQYHVLKQFEDESDYLHDTPLAAELWRNLSLQGLPVALSTKMVRQLGLEPSQPFPWDTDRHLYYIKSLHQIHCLKLMRHALVGLFNNGVTEIEKGHLLHCIESFRQDIICEADDTFLPYNPGHHLGAGKYMVCRDWNELHEWATQDEFDSCWDMEDDYRPAVHFLERFSHCKPTSRYRATAEGYFQLHGHNPTFKDEIERGSES